MNRQTKKKYRLRNWDDVQEFEKYARLITELMISCLPREQVERLMLARLNERDFSTLQCWFNHDKDFTATVAALQTQDFSRFVELTLFNVFSELERALVEYLDSLDFTPEVEVQNAEIVVRNPLPFLQYTTWPMEDYSYLVVKTSIDKQKFWAEKWSRSEQKILQKVYAYKKNRSGRYVIAKDEFAKALIEMNELLGNPTDR